ncbi:uncharacterized protein LOC122950026 isoform X2 [Acropora millepora]|uniref:uncharacterized protein LOC122950026 isoform X2 n=1 Tax=Acropora millepora TaxID=45264 RepID=UPI001CF12D36|nr:uncharacterized protein LOC122950026 isoform X2 [Acropora millepora]
MADELVLRDKCCPLRNFPSETRSVYSLPVFMSLLPSRVCSPVAADTIVLSVNSVVEHLTALESNHQQEKNNKRTEWALASLIIGQKYKTAKRDYLNIINNIVVIIIKFCHHYFLSLVNIVNHCCHLILSSLS